MNENLPLIQKAFLNRKLLSLFSCVLFIFVFSFPIFEADHHCSHSHDCSTCLVIQGIQDVLSSSNVGFAAVVVFVAAFACIFWKGTPCERCERETLVGLKVRLDN
ncbi:MAG: hypothetical protein J6Z31_01200 [Fibrobacter sp.]|nr:hypothetical protein [Fibrobacter sp.]